MPKIKNRKIISRTDLFRIDKLNIKFDNNRVRDYEVICGTGQGAVMIIPVLDDEIIFIREYAAAIDDYSLSLPKGKIDEGETVIEAANRELQEEIGYKSSDIKFLYLLDLAPGYVNHKTNIVIARSLSESKLIGDEPEPLDVIRCKINNLSSFLSSEKNIDSRVLSSIYILKEFTDDFG